MNTTPFLEQWKQDAAALHARIDAQGAGFREEATMTEKSPLDVIENYLCETNEREDEDGSVWDASDAFAALEKVKAELSACSAECKRLLSIYESAVQGRQEFRAAYLEARRQINDYGRALMMIREGCADPAGLARDTLAKFAR